MSRSFDLLHHRVVEDVLDRLKFAARPFPSILVHGAGGAGEDFRSVRGVTDLFFLDDVYEEDGQNPGRIVADDESLPLGAGMLDAIVSIFRLHSVNDLIGALIQARLALKPDGIFLAALLSDGTLSTAKASMQAAEAGITGALWQRFHPQGSAEQFAGALQRAGFALPVVDTDQVEIQYRDLGQVFADLRAIGEQNGLESIAKPLRRDVLHEAKKQFSLSGGRERFSIVYLTGWAPSPEQPSPRPRGSATASMEAAIKRFAE